MDNGHISTEKQNKSLIEMFVHKFGRKINA